MAEEDQLSADLFDETFLKKVKQILPGLPAIQFPLSAMQSGFRATLAFKQWHKALNLCVKERSDHEKINIYFIGINSLYRGTGAA
jgi:hypothetical protein